MLADRIPSENRRIIMFCNTILCEVRFAVKNEIACSIVVQIVTPIEVEVCQINQIKKYNWQSSSTRNFFRHFDLKQCFVGFVKTAFSELNVKDIIFLMPLFQGNGRIHFKGQYS